MKVVSVVARVFGAGRSRDANTESREAARDAAVRRERSEGRAALLALGQHPALHHRDELP